MTELVESGQYRRLRKVYCWYTADVFVNRSFFYSWAIDVVDLTDCVYELLEPVVLFCWLSVFPSFIRSFLPLVYCLEQLTSEERCGLLKDFFFSGVTVWGWVGEDTSIEVVVPSGHKPRVIG